jgi:hypothetical protein
MRWTRFAPLAVVAASAGVVLGALACRDASAPVVKQSSPSAAPSFATTASPELVDQLKAKFDRFREFQNAAGGGYNAQITNCMADPTLGGMGYHFGNPGLIDGTWEWDKPEILVYAPQPGGWKKLVAVEFVVPFTFWPETNTPPRLFNRDFKKNFTFNLWALHVWLWQKNPSGLFADWNPTVSCPPGTTSMAGMH